MSVEIYKSILKAKFSIPKMSLYWKSICILKYIKYFAFRLKEKLFNLHENAIIFKEMRITNRKFPYNLCENSVKYFIIRTFVSKQEWMNYNNINSYLYSRLLFRFFVFTKDGNPRT